MLQYFELLKVGSHQVFANVNPKVVLKIVNFQIGSLLIFCDITKNIIGKYWIKALLSLSQPLSVNGSKW